MEKVKENIAVYNDAVTEKNSTKFFSIEQTIEIPDDYRIFIELPHSVPSGVMAKIQINIPAASPKDISNSYYQTSNTIDEIRQLLQKEMNEKGTSSIKAESGDGWETHVRERYAQS